MTPDPEAIQAEVQRIEACLSDRGLSPADWVSLLLFGEAADEQVATMLETEGDRAVGSFDHDHAAFARPSSRSYARLGVVRGVLLAVAIGGLQK